MRKTREILASLGLSESEIKVYMAMVDGARAAGEIIRSARQKRPTVYYALGKLEERGLVSKTGRGAERYAVEPPEKLKILAQLRTKESAELEKEVAELVPSLAGKPGSRRRKPLVAFYEGVQAVKGAIMETLYYRDRRIDSIAPKDNFFWQVGQDFANAYVGERVRRGIRTRNLWEEPIDPKLFRKYYTTVSEIRLVPEVMRGKFVTTIFLYDDKALYISSLDNAYALLVTSKEHHDTMQALFEGIWSGSKPV